MPKAAHLGSPFKCASQSTRAAHDLRFTAYNCFIKPLRRQFIPPPSLLSTEIPTTMVSKSGDRAVVVDARDHMMGRLSSIVSKALLKGQAVDVVRCEEMAVSGGLVRQKSKFHRFLRKRMNTKPSHGPIHHRSPARIFWRAVRGMVPHKTARGEAALAKLKVFDGVPPPYDRTKRMVIPDALKYAPLTLTCHSFFCFLSSSCLLLTANSLVRVLRLQPGHKYCRLGDLAKEVGWNHQETIRVPCIPSIHEFSIRGMN